jgi:4-amino-4-deoxy-L-arabinose transferase-like glycosyltransferase
MTFERKKIPWFLLILVFAAGLKTWLLSLDVFPFNSDEAVVALMARHILQGERPIFFYGQAYMGSLDAFLVAGGFAIFGQQVWGIRLIQTLLYLGTIITTVWIAWLIFRDFKIGMIAALMLAVPTVNTTLYTTVSLGGYGEALLLGNLTLGLALTLVKKLRSSTCDLSQIQNNLDIYSGMFAWGILAGVGLWANGLTLIYSAPTGLGLLIALWGHRKKVKLQFWLSALFMAVLGGLAGSAPWWWYASTRGISGLVIELLGGAVAVEQVSWLVQLKNHAFNFFLLGGTVALGFRPPWDVRWLGLPLMPLILIFWTISIYFCIRKAIQSREHWIETGMVAGFGLMLTAGFLFTHFGVDPSGRYFLPFAVLFSLAGAAFIQKGLPSPVLRAVAVLLVLAFNLWGTIDCALQYPPGLTTQFDQTTVIDSRYLDDLAAFLKSKGETKGYTQYWVAYPLAFASQEDVVFIPRLPYHEDLLYTPRDDRYQPYDAVVAGSERVAYITANNPRLEALLREKFTANHVQWSEQKIGDYLVFYQLSRPVRPEEVGF